MRLFQGFILNEQDGEHPESFSAQGTQKDSQIEYEDEAYERNLFYERPTEPQGVVSLFNINY